MRAAASPVEAPEDTTQASTGAKILTFRPPQARHLGTLPEPQAAVPPGRARRRTGHQRRTSAVALALVLLLLGFTLGWLLRPTSSRPATAPQPPQASGQPDRGPATAASPAPTDRPPHPPATVKPTTRTGATGQSAPLPHADPPRADPAGSSPSAARRNQPAAAAPPQPSPPASRPNPVPPARKHVTIQILRADGRPGPLGRDVRLAGTIRGYSMACYWSGWDVRAASGWTGRYLKGRLDSGNGGSFSLGGLQLGSEGETNSEWHPLVVGADAAGCALLQQNLASTGTGHYTGAWPPPGATLLHRGGPVHRDE
jgi:hypothetical protein